ncbi:MAG: GAF domain-containing protein [Myxococcales bacterium]|nr:GAF domain-containing protein [Myxococcales bacterium]
MRLLIANLALPADDRPAWPRPRGAHRDGDRVSLLPCPQPRWQCGVRPVGCSRPAGVLQPALSAVPGPAWRDEDCVHRPRSQRVSIHDTAELRAHAALTDLRLGVVADIARALSTQLTQQQLLELVLERLTHALDADRATLFLVSDDGLELRARVALGADARDIRVRFGQGLAGWVAVQRRSLNVKDAYLDPRFDSDWDHATGYRTTSLVCQPVLDSEGELLGVVQVLNKHHGWFTVDDEELLHTIMAMTAIALVNLRMHGTLMVQNVEILEAHRQLEERANEIDLLYRLEREAADAVDLDALVTGLVERVAAAVPSSLVQVGRPTPAGGLVVHRSQRTGRNGDSRGSGPLGLAQVLLFETPAGMLGRVLQAGEGLDVCVLDGEARRDAAVAERLGFVPEAGVCLPLIDEGTLLGVLGVYDRPGRLPCLGDSDRKLLELVAGQVARAIGLRQQRELAEREDRLSAVGRALSGILHDFKTPMTVASGCVQLLKLEDDATERAQLADQTLRQLDRMVDMSKEVLAFARGETVVLYRKVQMVDFARDAAEVVRQVFAASPARTDVQTSYRGPARIDATKLLRVVQNIARNARDALADRGDGHFSIDMALDADTLVFTCSDNGTGVPVAFQHRMFDVFATTGKKDGTGLGLAIVKQFAEAHSGTVAYRDTAGGGATFEIRISRESH